MELIHPVPEHQDMPHNIINWICEQNLNKAQVKNLIRLDAPETTDEQVSELMDEAFKKLAAIHNEQNHPTEIIHQHISHYETIYSYFKSINNAAGMNRAMDRKEKLLNLLNDGNRISFRKSETVININRRAPDTYDLTRLTPNKQNRFNELLLKGTVS